MEASKLIGYDGCFATRLRELMKKAKVTQQDLAASVGTTRQAISQYADGSVQPNIEKLYKIAEFFHVSADYLLGMSDVTSLDADIKSVNKWLGLSEKSIRQLEIQMQFVHNYAKRNHLDDTKNTEALLNEYAKNVFMPNISVINLLLEEDIECDYSVMQLLGDFFNHERDQDPDANFVLSKSTLIDDDTTEEKVIKNTTFLNDADILAVRLLKLQQALMRYKNELDERKANGDK